MLRLVKQTNIQFTLGDYSLPLGLKQLFLPIISATQLLAEGQESQDKTQEQVDQLTSNLQSAMKVLVKSRYHARAYRSRK